MRGNVVDLAVAVIIGGAFGKVVTALTTDFLTPLIGVFGGTPNFKSVVFTINGSKFQIGDFVDAVIAFIMVAATIYFFIVAPMNAFTDRLKRGEVPPDPTTKKCPECCSEIPVAARRCAFCTSTLS
ncbi:MAG: large conductance mechanosensitive channel protein MscL [Bryobacteraceae bacterium]